jgi:hypothetical protein
MLERGKSYVAREVRFVYGFLRGRLIYWGGGTSFLDKFFVPFLVVTLGIWSKRFVSSFDTHTYTLLALYFVYLYSRLRENLVYMYIHPYAKY